MSGALEVSDKSFEEQVLKSDIPVLVDFWAPWCAPCRAISPVLDELAKEFGGKVKIVKVNVDENREAPSKYNVRSIPNLVLFKNGEAQDQLVGAVAKQVLLSAINKLI